jgi:predicted RNase H-like HicB family nuclease
MDYIAYLHKDHDSDFGVSFPDFPGCVTAGKTLEEARRMAVEALALHIAGMIEDGEVVPEPSNLDVLESDPAMRGAVALLVSVKPTTEKPCASISQRDRARSKQSTSWPARRV